MLERIRLQHARRRSANPQRLARSVQHNAAAQGLRLDDARGVCTLLRDYSIYENPPLILGGMMGISSGGRPRNFGNDRGERVQDRLPLWLEEILREGGLSFAPG